MILGDILKTGMKLAKFSNEVIAKKLREIVAAYEVKGEDRFKIRAYDNAATSVEHATEEVRDLWESGKIKELAGIGPAIADHLDELFRTGRVKHFDEVKKGLPEGMFEILGTPGIGAKNAYSLAKTLHLRKGSAKADLLRAARSGKIRGRPGFGEVSEKAILENLEKTKKDENRMSLPVAGEIARKIIDYLKKNPKVIHVDALGSLRRGTATVGDVDIAVATSNPKDVVAYFTRYPEAVETLNEGDVKGRIVLSSGRQIDLMTQKPEAYGSLLQHFTGSKNHNIHLRELAISKGLSLSEYGIRNKAGRVERFSTEEDFYKRLGLDYIPPELREDRGEVDLAAKHSLPDLIEVGDIKGDLQSHTVWSDGRATLEEMAARAKGKGYEYLGITDHQLSLETKGITAIRSEIKRRNELIEQINSSYKNFRVLNGIEILIKADRDLSYPDELLQEFDYVLAAIHTGFNQDKVRITQRITAALRNPFVKILAHPTTRLIGRRDVIDADWEEVFRVCRDEDKILEIDALPDRLDLPDILIQEAKKYGIKFAIDSDAHAVEHLDLISYGVTVARRGRLSKSDVINTLSFGKLKEVLKIKGR